MQSEKPDNDERVYRQVHLESSGGAPMMNVFGAWFVWISMLLALIMILRALSGI